MAIEHGSQRTTPNIPRQPKGERIDDLRPKGFNRFRNRVVVGVGGVAILSLAAGFLGAKSLGGDNDPTNPPKSVETSAPATPGEVTDPTPTPEATQTLQEALQFTDPDGETYDNPDDFIRAIELSADNYTPETIRKELLPDFIEGIDAWVHSGVDSTDEGAIERYDEAYAQALTNGSEEYLTGMLRSAHQGLIDQIKIDPAYEGHYKLGKIVTMIVGNGEMYFEFHLIYEDPQGKQDGVYSAHFVAADRQDDSGETRRAWELNEFKYKE